MTLHYQISRWPSYVRFDASGDAALDDMNALVEMVAATTRADGTRRVLVDLTGVRESLKFTDHYALGELVARRLAHLQRVASLVPSERRTGTSEKVANAQGQLLRVFVDVDQAIAWLDEPGA